MKFRSSEVKSSAPGRPLIREVWILETDRSERDRSEKDTDRQTDRQTDRLTHLSMFQRVQSGVVRCADDLCVVLVGRRAESRRHVVMGQTLGVTNGVKLPGGKGHTVQ